MGQSGVVPPLSHIYICLPCTLLLGQFYEPGRPDTIVTYCHYYYCTNTSNTNSNTSTSAQHIHTLISIWLIDDHLYSAILWSTVLSRLTALACGSTWVTRGRQKREIIYILSLHCHHQNDSCIKMGSGESHFNVSLTVGGKVTRQCPQSTTLEE